MTGSERPWIGVDLDGTLAEYHGWSPDIGKPVPRMMARVYKWLHEGVQVKIFTARISIDPELEGKKIRQWMTEAGLPPLEITDRKDMFMLSLWDDRCVQVIKNTGIAVKVDGEV